MRRVRRLAIVRPELSPIVVGSAERLGYQRTRRQYPLAALGMHFHLPLPLDLTGDFHGAHGLQLASPRVLAKQCNSIGGAMIEKQDVLEYLRNQQKITEASAKSTGMNYG